MIFLSCIIMYIILILYSYIAISKQPFLFLPSKENSPLDTFFLASNQPFLWGKTPPNSDLYMSPHFLFPFPLKLVVIWVFLPHSSMETALVRSPMTSPCLNRIVSSPSLDLSATFDTVDHSLFPILLLHLVFRTPHTLSTNLGYINFM